MAGDVDDVVDPAHDRQIAVLIEEPAVAGQVEPGIPREICADEGSVVFVQRRQASGRQRQLDGDGAILAAGDVGPGLVEGTDVVPGHRLRRGARLDREFLDAERVRGDGPASLRLPPVIDHRDAQLLLRPP